MKRVLIITYYWPPSGGSGVQRWLKFAKYLPQFGWEPVIYTPLNPEANATDEALLKDILPGTEVIKRKIVEPYGIYKALLGSKKEIPLKANIISNGENKSFVHRASMFIRGNLFIPDPRCLWIAPSVRYLKKYLKEHPVDAIVSTGPPHSMHLIAKGVSKATGIDWVADFRDPWTEIFFFKHLGLSKWAYKRHRKLEQSVLDNAKKVIVVSEKMREDFAKRTSTPVEIITNGFDPDDFKPEDDTINISPKAADNFESSNEACKKFRLVHTGILVDNGNPNMLWSILGQMANENAEFKKALEIRAMGQVDQSIVDDICNNGLKDNFVNMGYVAHNEAIKWQKAADLLLLPLRKEPEAAAILTGKFFEYVAAGAPILAFGPRKSNLATELEESGSGVICEWDERDAIRKAICEAYERFLNKEKKENLNDNITPLQENNISMESTADPHNMQMTKAQLKYSRKTLTGQLSGLLNSLNNLTK